MLKLWQQWRWRRFLAACARYQVVPLSDAEFRVAQDAIIELRTFTQVSGFLRDGRYPGGRHAERKIRADVSRLAAGVRPFHLT